MSWVGLGCGFNDLAIRSFGDYDEESAEDWEDDSWFSILDSWSMNVWMCEWWVGDYDYNYDYDYDYLGIIIIIL